MLVSLFNFHIITSSLNINTDLTSLFFLKTSKSTTREPLTSILTTRQTPTSKSTTRVQHQPFGYVPTKQKIHIFIVPILDTKNTQKAYIKPFQTSSFSTLDINTTVSMCET
jgi:hypothetical protein